MAAPAGCRFLGPIALVFCGPLVWSGLAEEPIPRAADPQTAAVVHARGDAQHASAPSQDPSRDKKDKQDKEGIARSNGGAAKGSATKADGKASGGPSAEELVRAALVAEAAGKSADREKLLRTALEKDPNYAPARWHLGYVRVGKEWLLWEETQRRAASDPRIAEYRRLFDQQAGTPAGEAVLARWCREQGLEDHARSHWLRLAGFQPQNEEALKALGMRWYQGQLLTHEQIVVARRGQDPQSTDRAGQQAHRKDWTKHWAPRVTKWQQMIREDDAAITSQFC